MREEILINITPHETRAAVVESGVVQEVHIERASNRGIVGNIYKGTVSRVMPGMQAAFVEIGHDRAAFIHVADIYQAYVNSDKKTTKHGLNQSSEQTLYRDITEILRQGQEILVQVIKDPLGSKGARLTTHITIPSRYLVLMPNSQHVGVSQRIDLTEERERLKLVVDNANKNGDTNFGYIIRTVAENANQKDIVSDHQFLVKLWELIQAQAKDSKAPCLIHEDLSLELRIVRDLLGADIERVRIDSAKSFERITRFVQKFTPEIHSRVEFYQSERAIFDLYNIEDEIKKALERKVPLKSGGYLVVDQTEAMTTIDVNTGGFVGHKTLEETIFRTNLEAATALARQLRLRNLGGIIIVDFIDMQDEEHKRQVLRTLQKALDRDHVKTQITEVSALGLVEMTRKRSRESLEHLLCQTCNQCNGRGFVKSPQTVCYDIFREISRSAITYDVQKFLILANTAVIECLLDEEANSLAELETDIEIPIKLQNENLYSVDQFDVVLI